MIEEDVQAEDKNKVVRRRCESEATHQERRDEWEAIERVVRREDATRDERRKGKS